MYNNYVSTNIASTNFRNIETEICPALIETETTFFKLDQNSVLHFKDMIHQ